MGISIESVWSKAQRLSASDRLALSRRLRESVNETDSVRQARVASEIDRFFGGWSDDPRTTDEIMQQIREGRTENTYPKLWLWPLSSIFWKHQPDIIEDFDLMIGTTGVIDDLTVVTHNTKHFSRIEGIKLEDWTL